MSCPGLSSSAGRTGFCPDVRQNRDSQAHLRNWRDPFTSDMRTRLKRNTGPAQGGKKQHHPGQIRKPQALLRLMGSAGHGNHQHKSCQRLCLQEPEHAAGWIIPPLQAQVRIARIIMPRQCSTQNMPATRDWNWWSRNALGRAMPKPLRHGAHAFWLPSRRWSGSASMLISAVYGPTI